MKTPTIKAYLARLSQDERITVWHLAIFHALIQLWANQGEVHPFPVSRKQIMRNAHIKSQTTYHKCIYDLERFKYIKYSPSYHPCKGSAVWFI